MGGREGMEEMDAEDGLDESLEFGETSNSKFLISHDPKELMVYIDGVDVELADSSEYIYTARDKH
jgi:hypothetical protein